MSYIGQVSRRRRARRARGFTLIEIMVVKIGNLYCCRPYKPLPHPKVEQV